LDERTEIDATLGAGGWFASLPAEIRAEVLSAGTVRNLTAGKCLFDEDGAPTGLHAVLSGELHIIGLSADGNAITMGIIRPGDWTGFLTCLDNLPHFYSGIARADTRTFSLRQADVTRIFERDVATFRLLLMPELTVSRKLRRFLLDDFGRPLAQRVAARLSDLGRSPYQFPVGPVVPLRNFSQEELAMSVVATRPRINKILRDFAAKGMIELGYGQITVIDLPALERFARDD